MEYNNNGLLNICSPIEKGYYDERAFFLSLMKYNFIGDNLTSNSYGSLEEYKKNIGKGSDFKLKVNNKTIEIEKKYLKARCYRAWVLRDYLPRFSYLPNSIPILVVSNKWNISYAGRKLLSEYHVKVFSDYEFAYWLANYHRKHSHPNKYILNLIKNRYENFIKNVKEDNLIGKSEVKESNSRVFSGNSKEKSKGDSKSKVNEHSKYILNIVSNMDIVSNEDNLRTRKEGAKMEENSSKNGKEREKREDSIDVSPDKAQTKPKESPKESFIEAKVNRHRTCFRCGQQFIKGSGYLCSNCIGLNDKDKVLWYSNIKTKLSKSGIPPICNACKKTIEVLSPIIVIRQRKYYYHKKCYNSLIGISDNESKETLNYILVNPDGSRREMIEVV
jgi:hypothetical protein